MDIRIDHMGDVAIVIASGSFVRESDADELSAALTGLIDGQKHPKVLVNLTQTRHVNTMALSVLVGAANRASSVDGSIALCGVQPTTNSLVTTRCFPLPIEIFDSCEEALKSLQEV